MSLENTGKTLKWTTRIDNRKLKKDAAKTKAEFKGVETDVKKKSMNIGKALTSAFAAIAASVIIQKLVQIGKALYKMNNEAQKLNSSLSFYFDATGSELENLAVRTRYLSKTLQTDYIDVIQSANAVAKEFNISNVQAFELIEKATEKGANKTGELLEQAKEYSAQLSQLGYSAEDMFEVITRSVDEGIFSDKGIDAIKEAGLRLREMPQATADALDAMDLNSKEIRQGLNDGSLTIKQVIKQVGNGLKTLNKDSETAGMILADVFGGPGEDAGLRYLSMLGDIGTGLDSLESGLSDIELAQMNFNKEWAKMQTEMTQTDGLLNKVSVGFTNLGTNMLKSMNKGGKARNELTKVINKLIEFDNETKIVSYGLSAFANYTRATYRALWVFIKKVLEGFTGVGTVITRILKKDFKGALEAAKSAITEITKTSLEAGIKTFKEFRVGFEKVKKRGPIPLLTDEESEEVIEKAYELGKETGNSYNDGVKETETDFLKVFEETLKLKNKKYQEYENARLTIGGEFAQKHFKNLVKEGETYEEYLKNVLNSLGDTEADREKKIIISEEIANINRYDLSSYEDTWKRRTQLAKKYQDLIQAAQRKYNNEEFETIKSNIEQEMKLELEKFDIENELMQSRQELYDEIVSEYEYLSAKQLQIRINQLDEELKRTEIAEEHKLALTEARFEAEAQLEEKKAAQKQNVADSIYQVTDTIRTLSTELDGASEKILQAADSITTILTSDSKSGKISGIISLFTMVIESIQELVYEDWMKAVNVPARQSEQALQEVESQMNAVNHQIERNIELLNELKGINFIEAAPETLDELSKQFDETFSGLQNLKVDLKGNEREVYKGSDIKKSWYNDLGNTLLLGGMAETEVVFDWKVKDTSSLMSLEDWENFYQEMLLSDWTIDGFRIDESDQKSIEQYIETLQQIDEQKKAIENQLQQTLTATTYDALVESIASGFKDGMTSAEDFSANFEELMNQAMFNLFKNKLYTENLSTWYSEFANAMSDQSLTTEEQEKLKKSYNDLIKNAENTWNELERLGMNFDDATKDSEQSGLQGAMKSMTEETAGLLVGQFGAMRMDIAKQADIATRSLTYLHNISRNSDYLKSIYTILSEMSGTTFDERTL